MPYDEYIYIAYNSLFLHYAHALVFMTSRRRHRSSSLFLLVSSHQVQTKKRSRVEDTALFTVSVWLTIALSYDVYVLPGLFRFFSRNMLDEKVTSTSTLTDDSRARYFDVAYNITFTDSTAPVTSERIFTTYTVLSRFNSYLATITYQSFLLQITI